MDQLRWAVTACALSTSMMIAAYLGLRQTVAIVLLVLLSIAWFGADQLEEGSVLFTVLPHHGLTTSDIPGVFGLLAAGILWLTRQRRRPGG